MNAITFPGIAASMLNTCAITLPASIRAISRV